MSCDEPNRVAVYVTKEMKEHARKLWRNGGVNPFEVEAPTCAEDRPIGIIIPPGKQGDQIRQDRAIEHRFLAAGGQEVCQRCNGDGWLYAFQHGYSEEGVHRYEKFQCDCCLGKKYMPIPGNVYQTQGPHGHYGNKLVPWVPK